MTNFFGYCEQHCEECGEVLAKMLRQFLMGKIDRTILQPKNPPHTSPSKTSNLFAKKIRGDSAALLAERSAI